MHVERYVAMGDSQSEGLNDHDGNGGFRGWADRFAEHLARHNPAMTYANLAIRGKLTRQMREEQLEPALALEPDLVSLMAGLNDVLRTGFDLEATAGNIDHMIAALTAQGAHVVTNTFPNIGRIAPMATRLVPRVRALNEAIREIGTRHGATVVDFEPSEEAVDRRIWSEDRIHANHLGHERIAFAFAREIGLSSATEDELTPLPDLPARSIVGTVIAEAQFLRAFAVPWIVRRARGRSSGDGLTPKRPALEPVLPQRTEGRTNS